MTGILGRKTIGIIELITQLSILINSSFYWVFVITEAKHKLCLPLNQTVT